MPAVPIMRRTRPKGLSSGGIVGLFLVGSISLPLFFRFGYLKARTMSTFLFVGAFFLPALLLDAAKEPGVAEILRYLQAQPDWAIVFGLAGLMVVLVGASLWISLKAYKHREF